MHDLNAIRLKEPQAVKNINRVKSALLCSLFLSVLIVTISIAEAL